MWKGSKKLANAGSASLAARGNRLKVSMPNSIPTYPQSDKVVLCAVVLNEVKHLEASYGITSKCFGEIFRFAQDDIEGRRLRRVMPISVTSVLSVATGSSAHQPAPAIQVAHSSPDSRQLPMSRSCAAGGVSAALTGRPRSVSTARPWRGTT